MKLKSVKQEKEERGIKNKETGGEGQKYEMKDCGMKKCQKDDFLAKKKQDYIEKTNGMDDYKDLSEADRENMNMIRSVEDDQEISGTNFTEMEEDDTSQRVKREIEELQRMFTSFMRRRRRSAGMMETKDYCIVKNMTCIQMPTRSQCRGFGVGRCGTMRDMLVKLFTPHVVMVSVVSIIVVVMVTVGLSYYCYKLKSENRVEPSEQVN